jgi:hypothetical protein
MELGEGEDDGRGFLQATAGRALIGVVTTGIPKAIA